MGRARAVLIALAVQQAVNNKKMSKTIKFIFIFLSLFIIVSCSTSRWVPTASLVPDNIQETLPVKGEKIVIIYSTDWCYWCKFAKKFMVDNKITFIERDYDNPKNKKKLKDFANKIGYSGRLDAVPTFVIGRKILVGFSAEQILCEIGRKKCKSTLFTTWETPLRKEKTNE